MVRKVGGQQVRWLRALAVIAVTIRVIARTPFVAGYRYLGVIDAKPATLPLGIRPAITMSASAADTAAIWAELDQTLWDRPGPVPQAPDVAYEREILVFATFFTSSSCAPTLGGGEFGGRAATVRIDGPTGFFGCSADAVPYTFVVAISRDRLGSGDPDIRVSPTLDPAVLSGPAMPDPYGRN